MYIVQSLFIDNLPVALNQMLTNSILQLLFWSHFKYETLFKAYSLIASVGCGLFYIRGFRPKKTVSGRISGIRPSTGQFDIRYIPT